MRPYGRSVLEFLEREWGFLFTWQQYAIVAGGILVGIALVVYLVSVVVRSRRKSG
jgi:hypothetical protein